MELTTNEKIKSVEKRIQFIVMLALFFPVVIEAIFSFTGTEPKDTGGVVLQSGITVFLIITSYLIFDWQKNTLSSRQLDYLNWISVSTIICFTYVVFFLALVTAESNQWFIKVGMFLYPFLLGGFAYLPVVNLFVMTQNIIETISNFIIRITE